MARLTWTVLWAAFAIAAATPQDYGYGSDNYAQQPQIPNADVPTDSGFCAGKENGAYSSGNDCSKDYWLCWNGASTSQECPLDLMFNEENGQCDYVNSIAACGGQPTTQAPLADNPTPEPVDYDCSGKDDGDYPLAPHVCKMDYVSCVAGTPWARTCPMVPGSNTQLSFDPDTRMCNWFENIIACGGSPPTAADVPELDYECPSPSGSFALVSAMCSPTYYICEDNKPSIAICSDDMIWDDSNKDCRLPADTEDCSYDCSGKADAAYSIGCSQTYWWCWEGKASKLACPEGMVFNGENGQCDFGNNVFECTGQRVTPTPASASDFATPPPVDFDCSSVKDGNHAMGGQCEPKFVSCVGGVAWEMTCPDGLLFDADQELCDRVDRIVACGGSLAEETTKAYDNSYSYSSYKPTTPRPLRKIQKKTTLADRPRQAYSQKKTTVAADVPIEENSYGSYEATTLADMTTRRRMHHKKTTVAADIPIEEKSYGNYETTTPIADVPTTRSYGYQTTPLADIPTTRRAYNQRKTTTQADIPTTRSYGGYSQRKTTTLADIPTTRSYGGYQSTTFADIPTTRRRVHHKKTTVAADVPLEENSYGNYETTTPIADVPIEEKSYGNYETTTQADIPTTRSYGGYSQRKTTLADVPLMTTRRRMHHKTTVAADVPVEKSYGNYEATTLADVPIMTTRRSYGQRTTTLADIPTTRSYGSYQTTPLADVPETTRGYSVRKTTTLADIPTTKSYGGYQTPAADVPIKTTRRMHHKKTTVAADVPIEEKSYGSYETTTVADVPTTTSSYDDGYGSFETTTLADVPIATTRRSSYAQKRTTTLADVPITRGSYYQTTPAARKQPIRRLLPKTTARPAIRRNSYYQTTTPAAEPTTTLNSYSYEATTLADVPIATTRSSYAQKRTTTLADVPLTRGSYYQTTLLAEPTTRQPYSRPVIRRLPKPQPVIRQSYQPTTPAAEPTTRQSYYQTTPAAEPVTRRTYKLTPTAEEQTTRKPQFKQSSYY